MIHSKPLKYLLCVVCLMFSACKSLQVNKQTGGLRTYKSNKIVEKVIAQQPEFQKMQAGKMNASISLGNKKISSGGSINYCEDSIFVLSIQPFLGIEMFRLEVTKEHVLLLDKMNRRYVKESFPNVMTPFGNDVQLSSLEGLLKNQLFAIGNEAFFDEKKNDDIQVNETQDCYTIQFVENEIKHEFTVDKVQCGIDRVKLSKPESANYISLNYHAKQQLNTVLFPTIWLFEIVSAEFTISCELKLSGISINDKLNVKKLDLRRFRKIGIEELMNNFNQ